MSEALIKQIEEKMLTSVNYLVDDFATIRTGRANPALVDKLNIEYYGTKTPLQQLATISVPDPKLLVIQPFDKTALEEIEKSILQADIGLNPANDGEVIRIPIPPLSEERRKELGKVASKFSEDAKVSVRSHRRNGIDEISKLKDDHSADEIKRLESKVQELTDNFVNKVDELLLVKQNELLEV
ncbi:MAG: ribosome recycling factor [Candidatus Actinomarina sp.]|jgi:ribosome recycling factor